jgi:hypothetical protein
VIFLSSKQLCFICDKMASSVTNVSDLRYYSIGNTASLHTDASSERYYPVNVYSTDSTSFGKKRWTFYDYICCLCCRQQHKAHADLPTDDPQSSLVRPIRNSYKVRQNDDREEPIVHRPPIVTVTRVVDDDVTKSTTKLLISNEKIASSITLNSPKHRIKRKVPDETSKGSNNSGNNTIKSGEKISFIREILQCGDSFLKSLEWFDNTLTRGKKYKSVECDEWLELRNDGIANWFSMALFVSRHVHLRILSRALH